MTVPMTGPEIILSCMFGAVLLYFIIGLGWYCIVDMKERRKAKKKPGRK